MLRVRREATQQAPRVPALEPRLVAAAYDEAGSAAGGLAPEEAPSAAAAEAPFVATVRRARWLPQARRARQAQRGLLSE